MALANAGPADIDPEEIIYIIEINASETEVGFKSGQSIRVGFSRAQIKNALENTITNVPLRDPLQR